MTTTYLMDLADQIQTFWSPTATQELRESLWLGQFVNKTYEGSIPAGGNTVKVYQVNAPEGEIRTIGTDADVFGSDKLVTQSVSIVADKLFTASFKLESLIDLQTQLDNGNPELRRSLAFSVARKINDYLYSLVSPSTSNPDHDITSVAASGMTVDQLADVRTLAGQAAWPFDGNWYGLLSPAYWGNLLKISALSSSDFVQDQPLVNGQQARRLMGFNMYEDNSRTGNYSIFFHKDFMHWVMQPMVEFKLSDLHPLNQNGYLLSCQIVGGAKLGIAGDKKHIRVSG